MPLNEFSFNKIISSNQNREHDDHIPLSLFQILSIKIKEKIVIFNGTFQMKLCTVFSMILNNNDSYCSYSRFSISKRQ